MLAKLRGQPANLGCPDQERKGAAEPAPLAGDDLVVNALLRRAHLGGGDLAVAVHGWVPLFMAAHHSEGVPPRSLPWRGYGELIHLKATCHLARPMLLLSFAQWEI